MSRKAALDKHSRIYVAGADTLIGSALLRRLAEEGCDDLHGAPGQAPPLTSSAAVEEFFARVEPEYVFHAGGRSGGIAANAEHPAELICDNLLSGVHVIDAAHRYGVKKLLYLASSCSYPRLCAQPMREEQLFGGPLEPTSAAYATAKLAGIKLCQAYRQQYGDDFIAGVPADAFGPGDDFRPEHSHVVAALLRRFHEARERGDEAVVVWGSGSPRRDFLFVDDLADACLVAMRRYSSPEPINLGGGRDTSIAELAETIRRVVGFPGRLEFDRSKPDGMPLKALDATKLLALGWRPKVTFEDALAATYQAYLAGLAKIP